MSTDPEDAYDASYPTWVCQGCGRKVDADYAYEHKAECQAYRQSLTEVSDPDDYDDLY